jgi:hypothetical protein
MTFKELRCIKVTIELVLNIGFVINSFATIGKNSKQEVHCYHHSPYHLPKINCITVAEEVIAVTSY